MILFYNVIVIASIALCVFLGDASTTVQLVLIALFFNYMFYKND